MDWYDILVATNRYWSAREVERHIEQEISGSSNVLNIKVNKVLTEERDQ